MSKNNHSTYSLSSIAVIKKDNGYILKNKNAELILSKKQSLLISCLINNINDKDDIIAHIWGATSGESKQNCYNQLIYQMRQRLAKAGLTGNLLVTHPRYGLSLNKACLHQDASFDKYIAKSLNDNSLCLASEVIKPEGDRGVETTSTNSFIF